MFDIGFSEILLVLTLGLIILGPKRLPVAIRTVMGWINTIRQLATNVQNELSQELKLQELQESIKKAESLNIENLSPELAETVNDLKASAEKMREDLEKKSTANNDATSTPEDQEIPIFSPKTAHSQPFSPAPTTPPPVITADSNNNEDGEDENQHKTKENEEQPVLQMNPDYYPTDDLADYNNPPRTTYDGKK